MATGEYESRRRFLKNLAALIGCQQFGTRVFAGEQNYSTEGKELPERRKSLAENRDGGINKSKHSYKLAEWTGDDFTLGHRLRIGDSPKFPEHAEKSIDFIIVGGGVAGLTAAYSLRDQDFLLLEQYDDLGGHSRGSSFNGIAYSYGAAYISDIDGIYGELYAELGIEPVKLPPDRNQFYYDGEWFVGTTGDKQKPIYREFRKLLDEAKPIWDQLPQEQDVFNLSVPELQKLDSTTFASNLQSYSKDFLALLDSFCASSFGGGINQLSALAGFSLLSDLALPTYVFKGGNPAIARALSGKVNSAGGGRVYKNAFVWKIEVRDEGASVYYSLEDSSVHKVDCKHVIVATPPLVAARQLAHIPDNLKAELFRFKFCSYLVANLLMKEKLFDGKYDCFAASPYSFADITVAETPYMLTDTYKRDMGSVLTVYQPYPAGSEGRTLLLVGDRERFADSITGQVEKLVPGFMNAVEEVVLTRWGHALALAGPNHFANLAKLHKYQGQGSFTLAHSSIYGWPCVESAIQAGKSAASRAKNAATKPGLFEK